MVSKMAARVEMSTREALLAIGFVFLTLITVALVQSGVITNPMVLGILVTLTIGLIFIGHAMVRAGVISRSAIPLWYIFAFGLVMLLYGGIYRGYIPLAFAISQASIAEIAVTNALFYTLLILSIVAAVASVYVLYKKKIIGHH